jgi:opacity protein-like surface antigen
MRKLFLTSLALGGLIVPAMAADMTPYYRAPLQAPAFSWTGFYIGVKSGWVIGGGVEWAPWANNWLVRAEFLNYNFTGISVGPLGGSDLTINEIRAGVAYKF